MPAEKSVLEQIKSWLASSEVKASAPVREVIKAQMQLVHYVQSQNLVDATIDTILFHLNNALTYSQNDSEKAIIRKSFSLIVQSYVLFMDARFQYEISDNKNEVREFVNEASESFLTGIAEITNATNGDTSAITTAELAKKLTINFLQDAHNNFSQKMWNRVNKSNFKEKQDEFYAVIYAIFIKLYSSRSLIGKSATISKLIVHYTPDICGYIGEKEKSRIAYYKSQEFRWSLLGWVGLVSLVGIIVSLIIVFLRRPSNASEGTSMDIWLSGQMFWTLDLFGALIILFIIGECAYLCFCKLKSVHLQKKSQTVETKLLRIAGWFDDNLQTI